MNALKPHVSLNVSNIDASVAFYESAFGVTVTKRRPSYAKFDLHTPSLNLTMQQAERTGVNASHFGVQVASSDDVVEAQRRFEAAGLRTFSEENTTCCYAVQDKVWVEDPDGNAWEVFVVKADAATMNCGGSPCEVGVSAPTASAPTASAPAAASCCVPKLRDAR
jgi:catechol 2,3-dioxygenase-like lactoylglutathione lyase family enzyme